MKHMKTVFCLVIFIAILISLSIIFLAGCVKDDVQISRITPRITTSGVLSSDEVWSGNISITGDINIPAGVTLTIMPGTIIYMKANYDDTGLGGEHIIDEITNIDPSATPKYTQTHINFNIRGALYAIGEPDNFIIFTSDAQNPYNTDWDGITFEKGSKGELKYVIVEWTHTGPALHETDNVKVSHSIIRHTFWGGLHAFQNSPIFEYNVLDDIGHEAFDTHKASPIIRFNNISHARTAVVFNYYDLNTEKPLIFENNIVKDSSSIAQLQENAYAIIRNNKFIGSNDTGGPWHYKGFTLGSELHSGCLGLADNVNVEIINNEFKGINGPSICYEKIGPNQGIGHTTNVPELFEIVGPVKILIKDNKFDKKEDEIFLNELKELDNVEIFDNEFVKINNI